MANMLFCSESVTSCSVILTEKKGGSAHAGSMLAPVFDVGPALTHHRPNIACYWADYALTDSVDNDDIMLFFNGRVIFSE